MRAPDSYLRPLIPRFACIFTYGGGDPVVMGYRALGGQHVVPVYNAVDPEAYHPVAPSQTYACDLFFMGNRLPDRGPASAAFFSGAAERLPTARSSLAGPAGMTSLYPPMCATSATAPRHCTRR